MTQATIVIANGAGAAVRAAINSQNEAQTTKQSGSSAPSPTYPFMEWADTANDLLKQRNAANSAWIIKGTLSAEYGGIPASGISYNPGSPTLLAATDVQGAIDELANRDTSLSYSEGALSSAVSLNNTASYFDGPSVSLVAGTWLVCGFVTVTDTIGAARILTRLWDGSTVYASPLGLVGQANEFTTISMCRTIQLAATTTIKISCRDQSSTNGAIANNSSGDTRDSVITAVRIA